MTERKKSEIVAELNEKLSVLKDQEDIVLGEAGIFADKRENLNAQVRNIRDEVLNLRSQRDELNSKVKELKQRRDGIRAGIHEKLDEIKRHVEEHKVLVKRKPSQSHQALQKEVESTDWTIQTTSLTLQEDRTLVEKVKQLETQLSIYRKLDQLAKRITQLRSEVGAMKAETDHLLGQLTENAQRSQETHRRMIEKIEQSKTLKAEADKMHKQFLQSKERERPIREEMKAVSNRIRQLKGEVREESQKERKESEDTLRETLENRAKEKLKRGEKLTWEEFQLLAEKGIPEQD